MIEIPMLRCGPTMNEVGLQVIPLGRLWRMVVMAFALRFLGGFAHGSTRHCRLQT